jgi:1,2-phenylacetyl-CoA epoxidase PaaB subunit
MSSDTIHVYDTWVHGKSGRIHFDVMTTDEPTALKLAKDQSIRHALEEACLVWVSMEDEVVHRAHERSGATQWHIEVRREEEIGFALLNEIGKRHLLAKRIVGEWRLFHRDTR